MVLMFLCGFMGITPPDMGEIPGFHVFCWSCLECVVWCYGSTVTDITIPHISKKKMGNETSAKVGVLVTF